MIWSLVAFLIFSAGMKAGRKTGWAMWSALIDFTVLLALLWLTYAP